MPPNHPIPTPTYEIININDSGDEYLSALIPLLKNAQYSIYLESYIFELPNPGSLILQLLEIKQKEGLDIRILIDGVGSLRYINELQSWSETTWVPTRIYNPLPWSTVNLHNDLNRFF